MIITGGIGRDFLILFFSTVFSVQILFSVGEIF